eukprot:scaffold8212_cov43-Attheya_sp.AAC.1
MLVFLVNSLVEDSDLLSDSLVNFWRTRWGFVGGLVGGLVVELGGGSLIRFWIVAGLVFGLVGDSLVNSLVNSLVEDSLVNSLEDSWWSRW